MKKEIDNNLNLKNIKPTAMRELVLQVLIVQKNAINLPELERKFDKADKATLARTPANVCPKTCMSISFAQIATKRFA